FLGQLNNINEQGFSWSDQMSFSGGGMRGGGGGEFVYSSNVPSLGGPSNGLSSTGAAGLNYNWFKTKKFSIRSSYFFNSVDNTLLQQSFRQNLSDIPFDDYEDSEELTDRNAHSFSLYSDIKPDSTQQIEINAGFGFGNRNAVNESILEKSIPGGTIQTRSVTTNDNTSDNLNGNASLTYMKRFGSNGRSASVNGNYRKSTDNSENLLEAITEYYSTGSTEALDQLQLAANESETMGGQFTYTEPLKKRKFVEFSYNFNQTESRYDKRVFDAPDLPVFNDSLSNDYSSLFTYHRPGVSFRYNGQTQNINAGLQYQISELSGQLNQAETDINKKYYHFLPRFMWRNDIGNGKNMRINYNTRVQQPTITQLSPVVDNTDPQRLSTGNPDLNAEYTHSLSLNYHSFTQFTSSSFFASLSGGITDNKIVTIRSIDGLLREVYSPINIDKESRINMYGSYGRPFKLIHSRVNFNANFTFTKTKNVIEGELLDLNRWSRTGSISISNMNSKVLEYNLGGSWTFTDNYYKSAEALDQNTLLHTYFVDLTLTVWKKWKLQGNYDYNLFVSNEFADNQVLPLFEASISRFILPNDRGQIKLSVFDVFDENRGLSRTSEINYIEELRSNSIGRYAMLSFIYALKGTGAQGMGPAPFMMRK
ncbi:MAG: outer membrane beta-barrel protein, partial [Saprospiraceae bacterium]